MPITPTYIVLHTSASGARGQDVKMLDDWHRAAGMAKIGYHFVVLDDRREDWWRDGEIQEGRRLGRQGAHCLGLNDRSIGICVVGDGDKRAWTLRQIQSVLWLCVDLCRRYGLDSAAVIGHREVNTLVARGALHDRYRTAKTCPGVGVALEHLRQKIAHLASRG